IGNFHALRHQGARAYQTISADPGAVEDDRADPDQGAVANRTAVQHGVVAHGDVAAHHKGETRVGVQHGTVLDIAAGPNLDALDVTAQHAAEPDAATLVEDDTADHRGVGRDEVAAADQSDRLPVKAVLHGFSSVNVSGSRPACRPRFARINSTRAVVPHTVSRCR